MLDGIDVVDAHFHLIDFDNNPYPWLDVDAPRPNIFGGKDLQLRHVFLEPDYYKAAGNLTIKKAVHKRRHARFAPIVQYQWVAKRAQGGLGYLFGAQGHLGLAHRESERPTDE